MEKQWSKSSKSVIQMIRQKANRKMLLAKNVFFKTVSECKNPAKLWAAQNTFNGIAHRMQPPTLLKSSRTDVSNDADKIPIQACLHSF
jgi:hypothetical protein